MYAVRKCLNNLTNERKIIAIFLKLQDAENFVKNNQEVFSSWYSDTPIKKLDIIRVNFSEKVLTNPSSQYIIYIDKKKGDKKMVARWYHIDSIEFVIADTFSSGKGIAFEIFFGWRETNNNMAKFIFSKKDWSIIDESVAYYKRYAKGE